MGGIFLSSIVLGLRFLLEVATVGGIFSGVFIKKSVYEKGVFALLAFSVTIIWAKYGAPKSPTVLTGTGKLILELIVYSVGALACFLLFGAKAGMIYFVVASLDLWLMYRLNLRG